MDFLAKNYSQIIEYGGYENLVADLIVSCGKIVVSKTVANNLAIAFEDSFVRTTLENTVTLKGSDTLIFQIGYLSVVCA